MGKYHCADFKARAREVMHFLPLDPQDQLTAERVSLPTGEQNQGGKSESRSQQSAPAG